MYSGTTFGYRAPEAAKFLAFLFISLPFLAAGYFLESEDRKRLTAPLLMVVGFFAINYRFGTLSPQYYLPGVLMASILFASQLRLRGPRLTRFSLLAIFYALALYIFPAYAHYHIENEAPPPEVALLNGQIATALESGERVWVDEVLKPAIMESASAISQVHWFDSVSQPPAEVIAAAGARPMTSFFVTCWTTEFQKPLVRNPFTDLWSETTRPYCATAHEVSRATVYPHNHPKELPYRFARLGLADFKLLPTQKTRPYAPGEILPLRYFRGASGTRPALDVVVNQEFSEIRTEVPIHLRGTFDFSEAARRLEFSTSSSCKSATALTVKVGGAESAETQVQSLDVSDDFCRSSPWACAHIASAKWNWFSGVYERRMEFNLKPDSHPRNTRSLSIEISVDPHPPCFIFLDPVRIF